MLRVQRLLLFLTLAAGSLAAPAEAAKRIALLIGNASYKDSVGPLKNPHNDVDLIAASLRLIGFRVNVLKDANYRTMDVAIRRHVARLRIAGPGAIGLFYYSGHGVANPETQTNYLLPTDVRDVNDPDVWFYAFEQATIIDRLNRRAGDATHFVIFDACRNELKIRNPSAKSITAEKGFVPVQSTAGLLIAYSTAPGKTASDEGTNGGPYARVLATELVKPGIEAVSMFRNVQIKVKQEIKQDPWLSFPSLPEIYLAGRHPNNAVSAKPPPAIAARPDPGNLLSLAPAARAWLVTKDSKSIAVLQAFAAEFQDSIFAKMARARIEELRRARPPKRDETVPNSRKQLAIKLQRELKRVGCYSSSIDGLWGVGSKQALRDFNKHNKKAFRADKPTPEAVAAIAKIFSRICPASQTSRSPADSSRTNPRSSKRSSPSYRSDCVPISECLWTCRRKGQHPNCQRRCQSGNWTRRGPVC